MPTRPTLTIESLSAATAIAHLDDLVTLLQAVVADGASVGFLPPLTVAEAVDYWQGVCTDLASGARHLWIARPPGQPLVGTVQLDLVQRANGRHRAEVAKLMVHPTARRQGIARALMATLEATAAQLGRTTLVLDTRQDDPSETLYQSLGYQRVGHIPRYARSASGALDGTAIYYRLLEPPTRP